MSDNPTPANAAPRVFKIGATRIVEDASTAGLTNEDVRVLLKNTYPEVANATIQESVSQDGTRVISYLPVAGRKG